VSPRKASFHHQISNPSPSPTKDDDTKVFIIGCVEREDKGYVRIYDDDVVWVSFTGVMSSISRDSLLCERPLIL
jgi:hypothetical protein